MVKRLKIDESDQGHQEPFQQQPFQQQQQPFQQQQQPFQQQQQQEQQQPQQQQHPFQQQQQPFQQQQQEQQQPQQQQQQHPFQQQQQQQQQDQQQQHFQQQQPLQTIRVQGTQQNPEENVNILGASSNSVTQSSSHHKPPYNSVTQPSTQSTNPYHIPLGTLQQSVQAYPQTPYQQLPGYNQTQTTSASVTYNSIIMPNSNSNNFSATKPTLYGPPPLQMSHHSINQTPNLSQSSLPTLQSSTLPNLSNPALSNINSMTTHYSNPSLTSNQQVGTHGGGSVAIYKPPAGGAQTSHRDDMIIAPPIGACPGVNQWPVPKGFIRNEGSYKTSGESLDELIQGLSPEHPMGPPVAQFPQRNNFSGIYGLRVTFPGESPKLVVKGDTADNRHLFTELGHCITTVVRHSADQSAAMRFLVVYSRDCEATQPVHPCKNHQNGDHPYHMLEVKSGSSIPTWGGDPHPSIIVAPSPSSEGKYSVQLKFLCRNSCITRKNLTLICQLEKEGQVVGRECLELKISACPRRDAKMPKPKDLQEMDTVDGNMESRPVTATANCAQTAPNGPPLLSNAMLPTVSQSDPPSISDILTSALESARRAAYLDLMEKKFQELHPEDHANTKADFDTWWYSKNTI